MYKQVYSSSNFRFKKKFFFHGHEPLKAKGKGIMSESEFKYRIAGNIDEDLNLTLWRFKHQIAKNKTVKKSRGLIKFAIHCVPFIAHHCWRVKLWRSSALNL